MSTATQPEPTKVDKSGERIQEMFGEISPRYDFMNHFLSGGTDYYWRWRTVRKAPPIGDAPILDVCSGTGDLAFAYWKTGRGVIPVVGTDFTHEMLVLANQKVEQKLKPGDDRQRPTFLEADTMQLPFPDNEFQIVSVAFGLRNVSDTMAGLREMTRVCQPGGRVVVLEFSLPNNRLIRASYQWYFRNILPRLGQVLMRNNYAAYHYLPQSVSEFPQGSELAGMMENAGMRDVSWTPMTFGVATLYCGIKKDAEDGSDEVSGVKSDA